MGDLGGLGHLGGVGGLGDFGGMGGLCDLGGLDILMIWVLLVPDKSFICSRKVLDRSQIGPREDPNNFDPELISRCFAS